MEKEAQERANCRTASTSPILFFNFIPTHDSLPKLLPRHPEFELQQLAPQALPSAHQPVGILTLAFAVLFQDSDFSGCASSELFQTFREIIGLNAEVLYLVALDRVLQS